VEIAFAPKHRIDRGESTSNAIGEMRKVVIEPCTNVDEDVIQVSVLDLHGLARTLIAPSAAVNAMLQAMKAMLQARNETLSFSLPVCSRSGLRALS
jgi:hypothetical protein